MPQRADTPNPQQQEFLDGLEMGLHPVQAADRAKYKNPKREASRLLKLPCIAPRVQELRAIAEQEMAMSRQKVQDIVTDAIGMARLMSDPMAMIRGAQELNKMLGYYAPEKKQIDVTRNQRRLQTQFEEMSDQDLLEAIEGELIEDAEYEEIEDEDE